MRFSLCRIVLLAALATSFSSSATPASVPESAQLPPVHPFVSSSVAWSPSGSTVALGGSFGVVLYSYNGTLQRLAGLTNASSPAVALAWSPDGTRLAAALGAQRVTVWNTSTGAVLGHLDGHTAEMTSVAWSRDGAFLATSSKDKKVRVWDATTLKLVFTPPYTGTSYISALAWSPSGAQLAGGDTSALYLWSGTSGALQSQIATGQPTQGNLEWTPDGRRLMTPGPHLWDVLTRQEVGLLRQCTPGLDVVASLSPNGLGIASAGGSQTESSACILQLNSQHRQTGQVWLNSHDALDSISALDWRQDGQLVAMATQEGWLHLWDAFTGELRATATPPRIETRDLEQLVSLCVPEDLLEISLSRMLTGGSYGEFIFRVQSQPPQQFRANCARHLITTAEFLRAAQPPAPPTRPAPRPLVIESQCSPDPATYRMWRIRNPNPYDATVWWARASRPAIPAAMPFVVPAARREGAPGEWIFKTPTQAQDNTLRIVSGGFSVMSPPSTADACPLPAGDTVLIIDSSGSMSWNDPDGRRKEAAKAFLTISPPDNTVAVVDFDSAAKKLIGLTPLSSSQNIRAVSQAIDQIDSNGGTNIGAGVRLGATVLSGGRKEERAAILLTDGVGDYANEHLTYRQAGWSIYTLGFGEADAALLCRIARETRGDYNMGESCAAALAQSDSSPKYTAAADKDPASSPRFSVSSLSPATMVCAFQHIRSKLDGGSGVTCAPYSVLANRPTNLTADIPLEQRYWTLTVSWSSSATAARTSLVSPSGRQIDGSTVDPQVAYAKGRTFEVFRLANPEGGRWRVKLESTPSQTAIVGTAEMPLIPPNLPPDVSNAVANPTSLWPPQHRFADVAVTGVTDPDGDEVTLTITRVTQDEPVHEEGSGNTAPDAEGLGGPNVRLRAERTGGGNGRVYRVTFLAQDTKGASTEGSVTVCVPHDQGDAACIDDGQSFESTEP